MRIEVLTKVFLLAAALFLSSCSNKPISLDDIWESATEAWEDLPVLGGGDDNYLKSGSSKALQIPPDLTTPNHADALQIPDDEVSAKQVGYKASMQQVVLPEFLDMTIRRQGTVRWLEVDTDPMSLWEPIKSFWFNQGFDLVKDLPVLGLMETQWKEVNQAIPSAGKYSDVAEARKSSYAALRQKYRTRMEREPNSRTNIFITQRSSVVVGLNKSNEVVWGMRPPNPEKEAEIFVRIMEFLGSTRGNAAEKIKGKDIKDAVRIQMADLAGIPVLFVEDEYSNVWRQTGVALDRAGLYVDDYYRDKGIYLVSKIDKAGRQTQYEVRLLQQKKRTVITAHFAKSKKKINSALAKNILRHVLAAYN